MPRVDTYEIITTPDGVVMKPIQPIGEDQIGIQRPDLFCVVYRTGGTQNFKWHRTLAMTRDEADGVFASTILAGYVAYYEDFYKSVSIGLPETFSPDFPLDMQWE